MPPPGQSPPNGNGSSPHNGRADEPSAGERLTRLEVQMENVATKADLAAVNGRIDTLNEKIDGVKNELNQKIESEVGSLRSEMKSEMAALKSELKTQMQANFVSSLKWTLGVLVPFFSVVLTILKFL